MLPEEFLSEVAVWSSVIIPWWKEEIIGIVAEIGENLPVIDEVKNVIRPYCSTPWFAPHEIKMMTFLAWKLFLRIHQVVQSFFPLSLLQIYERENFLSLTAPVWPQEKGISSYIVAPDEKKLSEYLSQVDTKSAIIFPDNVSLRHWEDLFSDVFLDTYSRSFSLQKKHYNSILQGKEKILLWTRRTLLKRIGHYSTIYIVDEYLSDSLVIKQRHIPLWLFLEALEKSDYTIHYITTTPTVRTLYRFLQEKKPVHYL